MMTKMMAMMIALAGAALITACIATAPPAPTAHSNLEKVEEGVYSMPPGSADEVLNLDKYQDLRVLIIPGDVPQISDAHMASLRDWIAKGGTVWIEEPAMQNASLRLLAPFQQQDFHFKKTSGEHGGELVVRDKVDRLKINDDPLTEGVDQLYVYPRYSFDGTPGLKPLLEMTDVEGHHGTVIGAVKVGEGRVILDGTARTEAKTLGSKIAGFDVNHPNAIQQGNQWNSYDWDKLLANARDLAERAMGQESGTSGSSGRSSSGP
jgi:hypothetical protein